VGFVVNSLGSETWEFYIIDFFFYYFHFYYTEWWDSWQGVFVCRGGILLCLFCCY